VKISPTATDITQDAVQCRYESDYLTNLTLNDNKLK
jgi:hypothetical protein